jgi:Protein of unknown function (DUF1236)
MKYQRTALLAGVTALSLAGSGLASAQDSSKGEPSRGSTPHATQQTNQPGLSGHSVQEPGATSKGGQRAEESNRGTKGEKSMKGGANRAEQSNEKKGTTGSNEPQAGKATQDHVNHGNAAHEQDRDRNKNARDDERSNAVQDHDRMGDKNANEGNRSGHTAAEHENRTENNHAAAGMNVQLNEQQRSEIRTTVINAHSAPRVSSVDFDVTVGTVIPRRGIHVVPVPETLVRIEPEWRGFLYFVYEDEIVIVNPNDMKIVAVVPV